MTNVHDKIRKLLRLGESPNANEAAAAIAKAQALMQQYRIEAAMLEEPTAPKEEVRAWEEPIETVAGTWRSRLVVYLSRANGCFVYHSPRRGLIAVGTASNVNALRYLYGYCVQEIDLLTRKYSGNGRTWSNNFRVGCTDGIRDAIAAERERMLSEMRAAAQARTAQDSRALMIVNNAIVKVEQETVEAERYMRSKMRLVSRRACKPIYDAGARATGRSEGRNIYPGQRRTAVSGPAPKQLPNN